MTTDDQFPMWEKCALALAVLGGEGRADQVRDFLIREGEPAELAAVTRGLRYAGYWGDDRPPLVKIANPGQGRLNFYRLTDAGRSWAARVGGPDAGRTTP